MDNFENRKKSILLHSCCGPCSTAVIERLLPDYDITVYFYNPNITDPKEYEHRLSEERRFIAEFNEKNQENVKLIEGDYDPQVFFESVQGLETELEGGKRCTECFRLRMQKTVEIARKLGFECFDTTLSVSPHKDYARISAIGFALGDETLIYVNGNYKKKEGFKRSTQLAKEYDLYRQNYCGCEFSRREEP